MGRTLDSTQSELVAQRETRPIYLFAIDAGGQEFLSSNGTHELDEATYTPGHVMGLTVTDWIEASLKLVATPARTAKVQSGDWRRGRCDLYLLPCTRYPLIVEPGAVEDGYAMQGDTYGNPVLLLPGSFASVTDDGDGYVFRIRHRAYTSGWSPSLRIAPPVCNHLPRPGTVFVVGDERFVLEAR